MCNRLKKLLDFDFVFVPGEKTMDSNNILLHKGNQLHEILIFTVCGFGVFFTLLNYFNGFPFAALITSITIPLSIIAYVLHSAGYIFISKIWNTIQQIVVVSLISLTSAVEGGTNVFFIPIITGILITFQGREKKVGYTLAVTTILLSLFLLTTDYRLAQFESTAENLKTERILNYTGATVALFLELTFIIKLSGSFQDKLMDNSRQLLSKNKDLVKANSELDNFVYRVSHDLRSPLMSVKGLLSLVFQHSKLDEKGEMFIRRAETSINRLDDIIREILEYSRNSRLNLKIEAFDIRQMIELIFEDLRPIAGNGFSFMLNMDPPNEIESDGYRINTILRNLISNSVKYRKTTINNPFAEVTVKRLPQSIVISVADNGEGIPPQFRTRIFDMFFRATNTGEGTGLGLYICKEVIDKLNGKIEVKSTPGEGTTITIEIPQKKST